MRRFSMSVAVLFGVLGFESVASAQTGKPVSTTEVMEFPDDKLLTTPLVPESATIGAGHRVVRTLLVRPRVHFVPELLKSIENL